MRVAILSQNARAGDAIGQHVAEKAAAFVDRGAHVRVAVADARGVHPALESFTLQLGNRPDGPAWDALADADLVCVECPQHYDALDWLPLLADGRRRIIFDYHGVTPPSGRSAGLRAAPIDPRPYAGFADTVVAHSRFTQAELAGGAVIDPARVARLGLVAEPTTECTGTMRLPADALLFVGRLAPNKNVPCLIAALPLLPETVSLAIVGPSGGEHDAERVRCRAVAANLGVTHRVRFLGAVDGPTLATCYQSALALVIPSQHEGFGVPVVEAQAHGLPVLVARAGALSETIGSAGLTFIPHDPTDLARQVVRLRDSKPARVERDTIAVVTATFGDCPSGAERSLSAMARTLHDAGRRVVVFTTQMVGRVPPGLDVRVYPAEVADADRRASAASAVCSQPWADHEYLYHTTRSDRLVEAVAAESCAAVVVGPASSGLAPAVIAAVGNRAVLVPCLHDEPIARSPIVRQMFDSVGGVIYHSDSEREFAQGPIGLRHPNSTIVGAVVAPARGQAVRGRAWVGSQRYLLAVGRKCAEKNLSLLLDWTLSVGLPLVVIGDGPRLPRRDGLIDLGRVDEATKADVLAGATALVQLSVNESLSLVALEAMAEGVPVIAHADCPSIVEHLESGAGWAVRSREEFVAAVAELPAHGERRGRLGREYVARCFSDPASLRARLGRVVDDVALPLRHQLSLAGQRNAQRHSRAAWRSEWNRIVEKAIDTESPVRPTEVELVAAARIVDSPTWLVEVRHRSGLPLLARGPARAELIMRVRNATGETVGPDRAIPLPEAVCGRSIRMAVTLPNLAPGGYCLEAGWRARGVEEWHGILTNWDVTAAARPADPVARPLAEARTYQDLPDGYDDVTTGRLAGLKRWLKQKLLHNFRAGYVDVLSRQQSRVNRRVVDALDELARRDEGDRDAMRDQLAELTARLERLERRADRKEAVR